MSTVPWTSPRSRASPLAVDFVSGNRQLRSIVGTPTRFVSQQPDTFRGVFFLGNEPITEGEALVDPPDFHQIIDFTLGEVLPILLR